MINAIGQACIAAHSTAYPAYTCCVASVNKLQPKQFLQHCTQAIVHYPYLRSRIALLMNCSSVQSMSCTEIGGFLLDAYLGRSMDSTQLRMLDEIFSLTFPQAVLQ